MPVAGALGGRDPGVLRSDSLGQFGLHHLVHDDQTGGRGERHQPVLDRPGHLGQGHGRLNGQVSHSGRLLRLGDGHNSYFLLHGGPLPKWVTWSCPIPTSWQVSGGGPPLHFNKLGDNVRTGAVTR